MKTRSAEGLGYRLGRLSLCSASALALSAAASLASAPAAAQDAADESALEEIVVTAQFREQSLQDTPISITALTGIELDARGFTSFDDLQSMAPNLRLFRANAAFGNTVAAAIRGIGQGDFNFASEPGIGIYIDDVYYAYTFGSNFDLLDLERVEVLRGPQGTLFGKNAIGGAIRLVSKKPQGDGSGHLEVTYGRYDRVDVKGSMDVSLVEDKLSLRVAGSSKSSKGYQDLLDFTCDQPALAGTFPSAIPLSSRGCKMGSYGGEDVQAVRATAYFTPNDRLSVTLTGDYMRDDSRQAADKLLVIGDEFGNENTVIGSFAGMPGLIQFINAVDFLPNYGIAFDARFVTDDPYSTYGTYRDPLRGYDSSQQSTVRSWGASGVIDYEFNENFSFKSITAFRGFSGIIPHDPDQSPLAIQTVVSFLGNDSFTQEVRFSGKLLDDKLFMTVGGFYGDFDGTLQGLVYLALIPLPTLNGRFGFDQDDLITVKNKSVFAHAEYQLSEQLSLVGGLRYTDEKKTYHFNHVPFLFGLAQPSPYDRVDWRVGLNYRMNDQVMVFAQASTGFRGGGINPRPFSASQLIPFGPETITQYEIGAKTDLMDNRVRLNLAAFYTDFNDRQANRNTIDLNGLPFTGPTNQGTGSIKGFEAEMTGQVSEDFRVYSQLGYQTFKTKDPGYAGLRPATGVPDWTAGAGAEYDIAAGDGVVTARVDWIYQSRADFDIQNDDRAATKARHLVNARLTWHPSEEWEAALAVQNVFDTFYYVSKFTLLPFGLGTLEGQPSRPRTWAVTVKRNF